MESFLFYHTGYHRDFSGTGPAFDLSFALERLGPAGIHLLMHQFHGKFAAQTLASLGARMLPDAAQYVRRNTGIKRLVPALQDVNVPVYGWNSTTPFYDEACGGSLGPDEA